MNYLAIDSSCSVLSVAVSCGDELFYIEGDADMKASSLLIDYIDGLLKRAGLKSEDLESVLCMGGPGSFTGLRIGYSAAKGLALVLSIPFLAVPTLDCMAYASDTQGLVMPIIKAGKNSYYWAVFKSGEKIIPDEESSAERLAAFINNKYSEGEKITVTGPAAASFFDTLSNEDKLKAGFNCEIKGYAKELILIAKKQKLTNNIINAFLYSGPEYIKKTDAELNLPRVVI